jgi:hypothetical protein
MSGYQDNSNDLTNLFAPYISGQTKASTVGYQVNTNDLSNIYTKYITPPYTSGATIDTNAGYKSTNNGNNDLTSVFLQKNHFLFKGLSSASISGCKACYSLKLLNPEYTGAVIKIRRLSDGSLNDFYSDICGNLKQSDGTLLSTFIASTTPYVDTWYDQSGKGNHATQTATGSQPYFINANPPYLDFGYIAISNFFMTMPSGTVPVGVLDASYSFIVKHGGSSRNTTDGAFIGSGTATNNKSNVFRLNGGMNKYWNYWWNNDYGWSNSNSTYPVVAGVTYNGSTGSKVRKGYISGTAQTSSTDTGYTNDSAGTQYIGRTSQTGQYLQGQLYAVLIFSVELTQSDVTLLNNL